MLIDKNLDFWDHLLVLVAWAVIFVSAFQGCLPGLDVIAPCMPPRR